MRRDTQLKWLIVLLTILVDAVLLARLDLAFPPGDAVQPLLVTAVLGAAAWFYRHRSWQFVLCLTALLHVTLFTSAYSVLMYCGGSLGRPFIDQHLSSFDALCGIHLPTIVDWANHNPAIRSVLDLAYHSLLIQTPIVIIVLGFRSKREPLEGFVLQFMVSTLITATVFFAFPAEGPFAKYGFETSASQAAYLEHIHELRSGERTIATWRGAEGLITFPSYHTTWAILLAFALRRHGWLTVLSVVLNGAVIAATLTTGWHYFADVMGGSVVAVGAIALCHALEPWLNSEPLAVNLRKNAKALSPALTPY
ncbi:MAG: phosphatase PAP2 family protein [Planctomycetota bacterium]|nr:phosphatase PAP2 family protein [Planctomycetota bacterium]